MPNLRLRPFLSALLIKFGLPAGESWGLEPQCGDVEAVKSPDGWACPKRAYYSGGEAGYDLVGGVWRDSGGACLAHGNGSRYTSYTNEERGIQRRVTLARWVCRYGRAHGPSEGFAVDGRKVAQGAFSGGVKHGMWKEWNDAGELSAGEYCNGQPCGTWVERSGGTTERGRYDEGARCGRWTSDSKDEPPSSKHHDACLGGTTEADGYEGPFQNGTREGLWVSKDDEGKVVGRGKYCRGQKCGAWLEDGERGLESGSYLGGQRCGRWLLKSDSGVESKQHPPCG